MVSQLVKLAIRDLPTAVDERRLIGKARRRSPQDFADHH
jgi:hypothetical protein